MYNMREQNYIVVRAKGPRKRKIERYETKLVGNDPVTEFRSFVDRYKLRDIQSARVIPYLVDDSVEGITMRTLLPSGAGRELI